MFQQLDRMYFLRRNFNEKLFTEAGDVGREENKNGLLKHMKNFLKMVPENSDLN